MSQQAGIESPLYSLTPGPRVTFNSPCQADIKYFWWKTGGHCGGGDHQPVLWLCEKTVNTSQARGRTGWELQQGFISLPVSRSPASQSPIFNNNCRAPQPSDFTVNFTPWEKLFWWLLLGLGTLVRRNSLIGDCLIYSGGREGESSHALDDGNTTFDSSSSIERFGKNLYFYNQSWTTTSLKNILRQWVFFFTSFIHRHDLTLLIALSRAD